MGHKRPDSSGARQGGFLAAFSVLAAVAMLAVGVALLLGGFSPLSWFGAFVGAFLLAPAALVVGLRAVLGDRSLRRPLAALKREEERLQIERAELEARTREVEQRAQRVEQQWATVQEASRKAAARASKTGEEPADRKELARLRAELQKREVADRQLSTRIAELEAAQAEAEATLRGILDESRARIQAGDESEPSVEGPPEGSAGAGGSKGVSSEQRRKVRHDASTLLAVAAEKARLLIAEAEERARLLKAQGEAELNAAIREIQEKEELEKALAARIAELEEEKTAAEVDLGRLRPGREPTKNA